jgi:5-methylcytosine-specific restriction endonuclease McrA
MVPRICPASANDGPGRDRQVSVDVPKISAQSGPWRNTRACHLLTYPECRACGTRDDVVVHHLRYRGKRGESEKPGDLMTLCKMHHDEYHRIYGLAGLITNTLAYVERIAQETLAGGSLAPAGPLPSPTESPAKRVRRLKPKKVKKPPGGRVTVRSGAIERGASKSIAEWYRS